MIQEAFELEVNRRAVFPETKYMGSKQRLLPFIKQHLAQLQFDTALDAFSGTGCVAFMLKTMGKRVYANDFLKFCFHVARAAVENSETALSKADISRLLEWNSRRQTLIRDTYAGLFFDASDCDFLDNLWANISQLRNDAKRSIALAAASRAAMKKRPRGLFTFTGTNGWDGRRDLRLTMREQFVAAVEVYNNCIFSNGQRNHAFNEDVFSIAPDECDLVYLDPPYISHYSDCDYTRRYHFVEGFCTYWKETPIVPTTKTKKIKSYATAFSSRNSAVDAFRRLFHHFRRGIIALSYSSNCVPNREEVVALLREVKRNVVVHEAHHRYHHGNHAHKVNDNNNRVTEYLFIAQ